MSSIWYQEITLLTLRPGILILAIILAVLRTRQSPRYLRIYLLAELVSTIGGELSYAVFGWSSVIFAVFYCFFRSLELLGAMIMGRAPLRGLLFGLAMGVFALAGIHSANTNSMIALAEGVGFFIVGASLAFSLGWHSDKLTGAILAITWILLGIFDMGYAMEWQKKFWQELNLWWPSAICILCFSLVAIFKSPLFRVAGVRDTVTQGRFSGAGLPR